MTYQDKDERNRALLLVRVFIVLRHIIFATDLQPKVPFSWDETTNDVLFIASKDHFNDCRPKLHRSTAFFPSRFSSDYVFIATAIIMGLHSLLLRIITPGYDHKYFSCIDTPGGGCKDRNAMWTSILFNSLWCGLCRN